MTSHEYNINMQTVTHKGLTFGLLYSRAQINEVVSRLAGEINSYYSELKKDGEIDLVVVCVLKGAFMFFSDLIKHIQHPHRVEFVRCRSY